MMILKDYRNWILSHSVEGGKIHQNGENILIETKLARGEINFYELEVTIVEMSATSLDDDDNKFYLHFELKDLDHAKELFGEMLETIESLKNQQKIKILLCCTSGLTTNYFKDKLNEAVTFIRACMEEKPFPEFDLPLIAEASAGTTFGTMEELED